MPIQCSSVNLNAYVASAGQDKMEDILKDERFKHIAKDPRFRKIPRSQKKVKIDKRFQSMFYDKSFKLKYTVDKRGRPINKTSNEDLEKFYHLSSESEDNESETEQEKVEENVSKGSKQIQTISKEGKNKLKLKQQRTEEIPSSSHESLKKDKKNVASSSIKNRVEIGEQSESEEDEEEEEEEEEEESDEDSSEGARSDDEAVDDNIKAKLKDLSVDYARGEGAILSDSSSDELTEDEEDEEDDVVHGWGELDRDAEKVEESTRRLALCNMDWDRIRATDIMVLLNSFVPAGGLIHSITVYPSEYGIERMKLEKEQGPVELYGGDEASGDEDKTDQKYHMERLRQYQLNRLRYFYAIIECDTVATADHLYKECDGREYESSATRLDLRFVPDDTTFDQEPREKCTEMPEIRKYKPRNFLTTALQQSKVDMTWDETDPDRAALASRVASGDIDDDDLKAYLASSSEEEDSEEEQTGKVNKEENEDEGEESSENESDNGDSDDDAIAKYRRALQSTAEEEEEEKEKEKDVQMEVTWDVGLQKAAEEAVKKKIEEKEERTPFQEMMHRRKEKMKEKKRIKGEDKVEESDQSDDYIPADVDLEDPYFREEYDKLEKEKKKKKKKNEETEEDVERKKWAQLNSNKKARQKKTRREIEEEAAKESNFAVDVNDDRFSALYTSHLFNIDPTDSNFRKTSGVDALINEKLQRRAKQPESKIPSEPPSKKARIGNEGCGQDSDSELSALVKSVKSKAQNLQSAKKRQHKDLK